MSHPTFKPSGIRIAKPGSTLPVRRTLIIGLGGTGCAALQWINELLRELYGNIPPFIKLLALDSDMLDPVRKVRHPFPRSDFYNLFESIRVGDIIRDYSRYPEFHPALKILEGLKLPAAIVERGCQGLSRLGRVVFFETWERVIRRAVSERFRALNKNSLAAEVASLPPVGQHQLTAEVPVVHMIGSVCGGTGSGMFLDMAYGMKEVGEATFNCKPEVYAHMLLPEAFHIETVPIMEKLRAVGHTMLQQVEFLMDHRRPTVPVEYPRSKKQEFVSNEAPFTTCFLVNGHSADGGGTRDELVELIARAVKSMVVEPTGSVLLSDLCNKQCDALSKKDAQTHRLTCFASYGLTLGAFQNPMTDPRMNELTHQWLYDGISRCTRQRIADSKLEERIREDFKETLDKQLSPESVLKECVPDASDYNMPAYRPTTADQSKAFKHVSDSISVYFDEYVAATKRSLAAAFAARRGQVEQQIKEDLKEKIAAATRKPAEDAAEKDPPPILPVFRIYDDLLQQLRRENSKQASTTTETELKNKVISGVRELFSKFKSMNNGTLDDSRILLSEDKRVSQWVNHEFKKQSEVIKSLYAGYYYREHLKQLSESTTKPLVNDLEMLAAAAKDIELSAASKAEESRNGAVGRRKSSDASSPFAVPLFELKHPDESDAGVPSDLGHSLRMIVQEIVWNFLESAKPATARSADTSARRLQEVINKLERQIDQWKSKYGDSVLRATFRSADERDPAAHPLYPSVQNIIRRLTPKIAINKTARHTPWLPLLVAQYPETTCFNTLLKTMGTDFREAFIDDSYADHTNVYLQMLSLGVGFCLPALDNLDQYTSAETQYDFKGEDLWLDPKWAPLYRNMLEKLDDEAHASKQKDEESRHATRHRADQCKDYLLQLEVLLHPFFTDLSQRCKAFDEFKRQGLEIGMECHTRLEMARAECLQMIEKLRSHPIEDLQSFPQVSSPVMDRIEKDLLKNYLFPQVPLFAASVRERFYALRKAYDDLLLDYEAGRGL